MKEPWTGDLVGRMHNEEVTYQELADEAGVTKGYISLILNGKRTPKKWREKLENALETILRQRKQNSGETTILEDVPSADTQGAVNEGG